jgi:hypothetical protein
MVDFSYGQEKTPRRQVGPLNSKEDPWKVLKDPKRNYKEESCRLCLETLGRI